MKTPRRRPFVAGASLALAAFALLAAQAASATTRYAIPTSGATSGSCASWGTACTLQTALGVAASGDEMWVAAGVYVPTTDLVMSPSAADRGMSFDVPPGVAVYGGFAGTETALSERDPAANVTVLSGDIDGNDTNTDGNNIDETTADIQGSNSYTAVTMDGTLGTKVLSTTVLDGFTITGGNNTSSLRGGGLYCDGLGSGLECSPTVSKSSARPSARRFQTPSVGGSQAPTPGRISRPLLKVSGTFGADLGLCCLVERTRISC